MHPTSSREERSNAEVVRAAVTAFNWNDMDAMTVDCTDDVEARPFDEWPDEPVYYGKEGFKRLASAWWDNFSGQHLKIEREIEDGDRVVLLMTHTGTTNGVQIQQELGAVIEMKDGLIHRLQFEIGFDKTLQRAGIGTAP